MGDFLRKQIARHEGLRLKPYRDTVGKLTIGFGRNLDDRGISITTAEQMLDEDILVAAEDLERAFPWTKDLDDVRRGVLIEMSFNLGIVRLAKFTNTLAAVERRDFEAAAAGMLKSKWAKQVKGRAVTLARQMRTGER